MNKFLNLLQFLTRITVSKNLKYNNDMSDAIKFFPLVGMVIGFLLSILYYLISIISGGDVNLLLASLLVMAEAIITGGLHIDGFGDSFDGLFSYRSKERILEIMKDPTMGTNGIVAIVFLIILKITAIELALQKNMIWILFAMPAVARFAPVAMSYKARSARKNGMGELFIGKCSRKNFWLAFLYALLALVFSSFLYEKNYLKTILYSTSLLIIFIISILFRKSVYKKIDGITGDILGCITEMSELVFLIYILLINSFI